MFSVRDIMPMVTISMVIIIAYILIFWVQINTMPHDMIHLFLPHGVRMLAFILLRHASIPVMVIAQFTAGYFLDDVYPAASWILLLLVAASAMSPVLGYWLLRLFRIDPVPTDISKPLHWGYLLLFLAASTLFNGTCIAFLQVFVAGIDANYIEFAGALMVGDILGSLAIVVGYFLLKNSIELGQKLHRSS
jgi:hypothetical protein